MYQLTKLLDQNKLYVLSGNTIKSKEIERIAGYKTLKYIKEYIEINASSTILLTELFDETKYKSINGSARSLIYLNPLSKNDFSKLFFEFLQTKIPIDGFFVGRIEKNSALKQLHVNKNSLSNWRSIIINRKNRKKRLISSVREKLSHSLFRKKIQIFGRLGYIGYEIISETEIGSYLYFISKKKSEPSPLPKPTASPIIMLSRIGKNGKIISIYKIRTMYPYSEYIQDYIYKNNHLQACGKFNNDKRISKMGNIMRKYWIDELPMFINLIKGDIKFFGVRPLSKQYFDLYPDELKNIRTQFKPGLIPPYYADMPKSFDEIIDSEFKYLKAYKAYPLKTDLKYLAKALFNILIKFRRSK
jgi:lipopolysaccharide/colanic/teichoic acid biosynthesis glycosyltransferase